MKQEPIYIYEGDLLDFVQISFLRIISNFGGSKRINAFRNNGIEVGRSLVEKGYLEEKQRPEKRGTEFIITIKGQNYLEYAKKSQAHQVSPLLKTDSNLSNMHIVAKSSLITNSGRDHSEVITQAITSADKIVIFTAFLKISGLSQIRQSLQYAVNAGANVKILAGLDFFLTEPKALWELYELFEDRNNTTLYLACADKTTFHPKLYYFEQGGIVTIVVGSANLTNGGLSKNFELSVLQELPLNSPLVDELHSYIDTVEKDARVAPATRIDISQYERRYEIFSKKRKQAELEAANEVSAIPSYNKKIFKNYLKVYLNSRKDLDGFKKRTLAYIKAKKLLDELSAGQIKSKTHFMSIYEQLVGKKGSPGLWHSGNLFRKKNEVAQNYKKFIKLLSYIQDNLAESPEILFDNGIKYAFEIPGLGPNVLTEIMNTYAPNKFSVLNNNPVSSLRHLGFDIFKTIDKKQITAMKYFKFKVPHTNLCKVVGMSRLPMQ